jgi:uncharacterized protein (TIGR00369 family)
MDGEAPVDWQSAVRRIDEGEWAGWFSFGPFDPFEQTIGPFYFRRDEDGRPRCAFRAERRHMNGAGFMHGGCLMSFADFALFVIAQPVLDRPSVTATFNAEFTGAVREGELVQGTGEVVKAARSLVFVRGLLTADSGVAMSFSGTLKKTGLRPTS